MELLHRVALSMCFLKRFFVFGVGFHLSREKAQKNK